MAVTPIRHEGHSEQGWFHRSCPERGRIAVPQRASPTQRFGITLLGAEHCFLFFKHQVYIYTTPPTQLCPSTDFGHPETSTGLFVIYFSPLHGRSAKLFPESIENRAKRKCSVNLAYCWLGQGISANFLHSHQGAGKQRCRCCCCWGRVSILHLPCNRTKSQSISTYSVFHSEREQQTRTAVVVISLCQYGPHCRAYREAHTVVKI